MNGRNRSERRTPAGPMSPHTGPEKSLPVGYGKATAYLKIALPARLSSKCGESVYDIVREKLKTREVKLLLDASDIRFVDQEGLRWLYEISVLIKSKNLPKVVLREPNRVIRDAMIFSNIIKCFEIMENQNG